MSEEMIDAHPRSPFCRSRSFDMVTLLLQGYVLSLEMRLRRRMTISAKSAIKGISPRFASAVLSVLTTLAFTLIFSFFSVSEAHAHVLHSSAAAEATVEPSPEVAPASEGLASLVSECGVDCCSSAQCAAGLAAGCENGLRIQPVADAFGLPLEISAAPFDQSTHKRPPRS